MPSISNKKTLIDDLKVHQTKPALKPVARQYSQAASKVKEGCEQVVTSYIGTYLDKE